MPMLTAQLVGLLSFVKHIIRLRSWREKRRTLGFATAYFIAWIFDFIVPLMTSTLIVLIVYPPSRKFLFPPAPIALVGSDGAPQKPKAGVLGSKDSATGAPENYKGEAVEAEAQNFVNSIAQVALSSAAGKHPMNDPDDENDEGTAADAAPDPTAIAAGAANARTIVQGAQHPPHVDKTKAPMETAIWNKMRPAMHGLQDVVDTWERFANALDPTAPFPQEPFRLRIASLVVPLFAASIFITSYMFTKAMWAGVGFGFFGQPAMDRGLSYLNRHYPNWQRLLELRNTLLKGVPTNAQLTITLLRIGEVNKAPLPPPPVGSSAPDDVVAPLHSEHLDSTGDDAPLGATREEISAAAAHDGGVSAHHTDGGGVDASKDSKHGKKGHKVLGAFKASLKASVASALGADHVRAAAGSAKAKQRVGVVPKPSPDLFVAGPVDFQARYQGKKGHVYISTKATIPCVSFTTDHSVEKIGTQDREDLHPVWSVAVADIKELKKIGGFGWKAKLFVGWALERQVADGLEITTKTGEVVKVTAMMLRDELFNRLVAMGGQKWESW